MQKTGCNRGFVQLHLSKDACHGHRVHKVGLAGYSLLADVNLRGIDVGRSNQVQIGIRVIRFDEVLNLAESHYRLAARTHKRL